MNNNLNIRDKKMIYLNDAPLLSDAFDYVYCIDGFLVAVSSNKLVIVNSEGNIILSEEGTLCQVYGYGKCVSIKKGHTVGVYQYDGTLLLPFGEFSLVFISDSNHFEVKRTKQDVWTPYSI